MSKLSYTNKGLLLILTAVLSSCSVLHVKKTPSEYSLNYCGEKIKAPIAGFNTEKWVVFSDKKGNQSYQVPGAFSTLSDSIKFLQPFYVIGEKGDYLQLIEYDPSLVGKESKDTKIKDKEKVVKVGWMRKSDLLLSRQTITDIATGFKNKTLTIISDTTAVTQHRHLIENDSLITFQDDKLSTKNSKKAPLYGIYYTVKNSENNKNKLLAKRTIISPDNVNEEIIGWVPASLIRNIGQRMYVDINSMPKHSLYFKSKDHEDPLYIPEDYIRESYNDSRKRDALRYAPVYTYTKTRDNATFRTSLPLPLLDKRSYYVFNVDGEKIHFDQFKKWEKDLKKINIIFVFEGKDLVLKSYPKMMNVFQNMQGSFTTLNDGYEYQFGAVVAFEDRRTKKPVVKSVGLTPSYGTLSNFLSSELDNLNLYQGQTSQNTWSGLKAAADLVSQHKNESNILVIIGETGSAYNENMVEMGISTINPEELDSSLIGRLAYANTKVLGFQIYGEKTNAGNNFVLQMTNLIDRCGKATSISKREKIVYADQLTPENRYKEHEKNVYSLDFPENSMTQGWILFPEKDLDQPLTNLSNYIDSLLLEVKFDNNRLVTSMDKAFSEVAKFRGKLDPIWLKYSRLEKDSRFNINPEIDTDGPLWQITSQPFFLDSVINKSIEYSLLLSESEYTDLKDYLKESTKYEVAYKYKGKIKPRKLCNCPDDDNLDFQRALDEAEKKASIDGYENTKAIRAHLQQFFIKGLTACKVCLINKKDIINYTLAEAQEHIIGCPTNTPLLKKITINNLSNKRMVSDDMLRDLILHIKEKEKNLEKLKTAQTIDSFVSNGETYYWIPQILLP